MERKMYEPTQKESERWAAFVPPTMPTDDEFKALWKKAHRGKVAGWGMGKAEWVLRSVRGSREFGMGYGQGMVDAAREQPYADTTDDKAYNQGYHDGYTKYASNRKGWDANTRARFDEKYLNS